ncbi:MAG TPA: SLC13 family permease [Bacteroidales bacterium]|nr:MAG: potassium transporter TrkA [Bacteroidetes bacterium GWF2_33_38]OFY91336.1 MAG: potassium transporter TrkA [Bacteroidetes bacterium RIFOXYA2_FULL_33_7]HBF88582.1 SLC13 family permease [Bacteroidales bacterium]
MIDTIIVGVVLIFILLALYTELVGPAFTFLIAIISLGIFGILSPSEILNGFANEQIYVIIMLLLLGDIIRKTNLVEQVFDYIFGRTKTHRGFLGKMTLLVGGFSGFLNNTPLVAVMMPYVVNWSKKNEIAPSKLLIPLSFATILGGCITLIGTSTNLIVNGLVIENDIPGLTSLSMFDFTPVGLAMFLVGFFYLYFFAEKLLPTRKDDLTEFTTNAREYIIEAQVREGSRLIGQTVEEANLKNMNSLYLFQIIRNRVTISAVQSDEIIKQDDLLIFAGGTKDIADLFDSRSGLTFPEVGLLHRKKYTEVVEIVISHNSSLINQTVKEINFRKKYHAAILAIRRNGEKYTGLIGNMKLKAGDALLLLAGSDFNDRAEDSLDFYQISKVKEIRKTPFYKIAIILGGMATAIALSAFNIVPLFMSLISLITLLLMLNIASPKELHKNIDFNLAIIIALSLALGTAMIKTGFAELIAQNLISIFLPLGKYGILTGIYLITTVLAAFITNKASVALIFPISLAIAMEMGLPPLPFILVVAFASAANFMTPIGYQTNLMVYGPGNYSFKDFFKIGFPLTILYMIGTVLILGYFYF